MRPTLSVVVAVIAAAIAVLLFMDAVTWMSGSMRYTIIFERAFDTSESAAKIMRVVQATTAIAITAGCVGALPWIKRRA